MCLKFVFTCVTMQKADYAISHTIATAARSRIIDFPASHYAGRFGTIVPYPEVKTNIVATVKPLSYQVYTYNIIYTI